MCAPRRASWLLVCAVCAAGCSLQPWSRLEPVPVAALDAHGIRLEQIRQLAAGTPAEAVVGVLGEPLDRQPGCVPGERVWRYPIRAWNDVAESREIVPAAVLRAHFDASGTLTGWTFIDPLTGAPLAIRENLEAASLWYRKLSQAPAPVPPRIDLDRALVPGQTTLADVARTLGQWRPDLHCGYGGPAPVMRQTRAGAGTTQEWYADRPSALFIPPRYLVATFDHAGTLVAWHFEQTYPGGRE